MYISEVVSVGLFVVGVYLWKKYSKPDFFWSLFPIGGSLIISVLQYLSETFLHLSDETRITESLVFLVLRAIAFLAFGAIVLKGMSKEWR